MRSPPEVTTEVRPDAGAGTRPASGDGRTPPIPGTRRAVPLEVTWTVLSAALDRCGISRVADVTMLDDIGIPVWVAVRPAAESMATSQGKGSTPLAAKVSAVAESMEVQAAERAPQAEAHGIARQVGVCDDWLLGLERAPGSVVSPELSLDWVRGVSLVTGVETFVPRDALALSGVVEPRIALPTFRTGTNGLASGNTRDEALVHALCEVIERDCVSELHHSGPATFRRVRPESVEDPNCRELLAAMHAAGKTLSILDASNDIGVPCYEVRTWCPQLPLVCRGAGSHLCPEIALSRAITEAAQVRSTIISGGREDITDGLFRAVKSFRGREAPVPDGGRWVDFVAGSQAGFSLADDAAHLIDLLLSNRQAEPVAVDLTGCGGPLFVTRVVVPGLRHDTSPETSGGTL